jgi:hypothetical protein
VVFTEGVEAVVSVSRETDALRALLASVEAENRALRDALVACRELLTRVRPGDVALDNLRVQLIGTIQTMLDASKDAHAFRAEILKPAPAPAANIVPFDKGRKA